MRLFEATYKRFPCKVRLVEDVRGETVVTARGNVLARPGDYVALQVDEAPRGFRQEYIDRVIRREDKNLTVGEEIRPKVAEVKPQRATLADIEDEGDPDNVE